MLLKWTQEQDQELHRVIRRHGTSNWALVRKHFKGNRSRDSVIKRWHGKLKFQKYVPITPVQKTKKINNDRRRQAPKKKPSPIRRPAPNTIRKQNTQPPRPMSRLNIRSQRLRNIIERSQPKKAMEVPVPPEQPIESEQNRKINEQHAEQSEPNYNWSKMEDEKLLSLVVEEGITNWPRIASIIGCSQKDARDRWRKTIYNMIKLDDKVGGFLKYSTEEDTILTIGYRNGLNWGQLMDFLPGRSEFSIEARWRRLLRPELEIQLSKNKHYIIRQFLKRIVEKKQGEHAMVEQPAVNQAQGGLKNP